MEHDKDVLPEFIAIAYFKPLSLAGLLNPHCIEKIYNFQLHETILHCKNKIIINTHKSKNKRVRISVCGVFFTQSIFMPALKEH